MTQAAGVAENEEVIDPAVAAAEAAEAADFESGFNPSAPTESTPPAAEEEAGTTEPAEPAAAQAPAYRQVLESEWNELVAQSTQFRADLATVRDTAAGRVGGIERALKELQQNTPKGLELDVTDDIVADLKAEFPEIGDLTLKAFKNLAGKLKGSAPAGIDPAELTKLVDARTNARELEALEEDRPDWREVVGAGNPNANDLPYRKWLAAQPAEYQARLNSTYSALAIGRSIAKFEKAAAEAAAQALAQAKPAAEATPPATPSARKQRLEAAVTPKGTGGVPAGKSTDDEFEDGFKSG